MMFDFQINRPPHAKPSMAPVWTTVSYHAFQRKIQVLASGKDQTISECYPSHRIFPEKIKTICTQSRSNFNGAFNMLYGSNVGMQLEWIPVSVVELVEVKVLWWNSLDCDVTS